MSELIALHFYGDGRRLFGGPHKLHVSSVAAALRLMEANFPGKFYRWLKAGHFHIVRGKSIVGGHTLPADTPNDTVVDWLRMGSSEPVHIVPALAGSLGNSGKGAIMVAAGAVLLAAAFFVPGGFLGAMVAVFPGAGVGSLAATLAQVGLVLSIGGTYQLLAKAAKLNSIADVNGGIITTPVNSSNQGVCVPVVYGRVRGGTVTVSAGVVVLGTNMGSGFDGQHQGG